MFERSWVCILELYTGWTFCTLIYCEKIIVCLKRSKINETEARNGPFKNVLELKIKTDVGM